MSKAHPRDRYHFIVTADHGFIYKRDKVAESDKIDGIKNKTAFVNRRFVVASEPITGDGVASMNMGTILRNADSKWVSFPLSLIHISKAVVSSILS